jgi:uncharacterized protein
VIEMKLDLKRMKESPGQFFPIDWTEEWEELEYKNRKLPFRRAVRLRGQAYFQGGMVYLSAELDTELEIECSRCLKPISSVVHREELLEFQEEPPGSAGAPLEGFHYEFGAEELELTPYLESLIAASIESKPLCSPECKGLCPTCGKDLNEGPCEHVQTEQHTRDPRLAVLKELLPGT